MQNHSLYRRSPINLIESYIQNKLKDIPCNETHSLPWQYPRFHLPFSHPLCLLNTTLTRKRIRQNEHRTMDCSIRKNDSNVRVGNGFLAVSPEICCHWNTEALFLL